MPEKHRRQNRRRTGADYEKAAGYYLEQLGYEVLQYNYRCRSGEIDIVARDGEYLVFCEVKYRSDGEKEVPLRQWMQGNRERCTSVHAAIWQNTASGLPLQV